MTAGPLDVISVTEYIDKGLGLLISTIGFKDTITVSKYFRFLKLWILKF